MLHGVALCLAVGIAETAAHGGIYSVFAVVLPLLDSFWHRAMVSLKLPLYGLSASMRSVSMPVCRLISCATFAVAPVCE